LYNRTVFFRRVPAASYDWVIAGLGNPGERYKATRHNLGFMVVDALAERWKAGNKHQRCQGEVREARIEGKAVLLVKPMTFMNGSGLCVGPLMRRNKGASLIVVFDDVNLPLGKMRLRADGSAGGHKGAESVIRHYKSAFYRVRLGIGGGELEYLSDWVLEPFEPEEMPTVLAMVAAAVVKIEEIVTKGWEYAVTAGNTVNYVKGTVESQL
jgi:PTH1 family peptidyl-tRNA hydrolase